MTSEEYIGKMVAVFREVRRTLREDGTLWIVIGDSYATGAGKVGECPGGGPQGKAWKAHLMKGMTQPNRLPIPGLKPKDLIGIPWMLAFALREDGWYLRQDCIWNKPNPMPESVKDRPTRCHEYIFLLSKSRRYFYDHKAVKESVTGGAHPRGDGLNPKAFLGGDHPRNVDCRYQAPGMPEHTGLRKRGIQAKQNPSFSSSVTGLVDNRNKRSVWTVATHPYPEAHFATYPPKLIEPCILAGSRQGDVVLDPFMGAGTTAVVARYIGRRYIGIELNPEYITMAEERIRRETAQLNIFYNQEQSR